MILNLHFLNKKLKCILIIFILFILFIFILSIKKTIYIIQVNKNTGVTSIYVPLLLCYSLTFSCSIGIIDLEIVYPRCPKYTLMFNKINNIF